MNSDSWASWFRANFNLFLLALMFLFVLAVAVHSIHSGVDAGSVNWLQGIAGQFMAALIGMMTGIRMAASKDLPGIPKLPPSTTATAQHTDTDTVTVTRDPDAAEGAASARASAG